MCDGRRVKGDRRVRGDGFSGHGRAAKGVGQLAKRDKKLVMSGELKVTGDMRQAMGDEGQRRSDWIWATGEGR